MGEMPVETHFYADKREDVHDRTGCYFGRSSAMTPCEASGGQNTEKRKNDRHYRHQVGIRVWRPIALDNDFHSGAGRR